MDETNENENGPKQSLGAADQDVMKSEGVEIVDQAQTPADKDNAMQKETAAKEIGSDSLVDSAAATPSPEPVSFAAPTPKPFSQSPNNIKPIRTYRTDAEEAIGKNKTSVIDIAVAESKKKEQAPVEYKQEKKSSWLLWLSLALVIIALAVVGGAYYYLQTSNAQTSSGPSAQNSYPSIIEAEMTKTLPIDPKQPWSSLGTGITSLSSAPVGSIVNLIPIGAGGIAFATSSDFFSALGVTLPIQVNLSLDGTYMLGTIVSDPNEPFLILGISSFENAFAGMLGWEKTIHNDLASFIQIEHPSEPSISLVPETFVDKTIENQDVRELLDASSTPLLLYAFVGTTKLVITTDEAAMSSVIAALNTTNTTR